MELGCDLDVDFDIFTGLIAKIKKIHLSSCLMSCQ